MCHNYLYLHFHTPLNVCEHLEDVLLCEHREVVGEQLEDICDHAGPRSLVRHTRRLGYHEFASIGRLIKPLVHDII